METLALVTSMRRKVCKEEEEAKTRENSISLTLTLGHVLPHGLRKDFQVASPVWIAILESLPFLVTSLVWRSNLTGEKKKVTERYERSSLRE